MLGAQRRLRLVRRAKAADAAQARAPTRCRARGQRARRPRPRARRAADARAGRAIGPDVARRTTSPGSRVRTGGAHDDKVGEDVLEGYFLSRRLRGWSAPRRARGPGLEHRAGRYRSCACRAVVVVVVGRRAQPGRARRSVPRGRLRAIVPRGRGRVGRGSAASAASSSRAPIVLASFTYCAIASSRESAPACRCQPKGDAAHAKTFGCAVSQSPCVACLYRPYRSSSVRSSYADARCRTRPRGGERRLIH